MLPVLVAAAMHIGGPERLGMLADRGRGGKPGGRRDPMALVPVHRIALQLGDDHRQVILQAMMRLPAEQFARAAGIERIMIVRHHGHEGANERPLALVDGIRDDGLELGESPGARRSDRGGEAQCQPILHPVDERADLVLDRIIAERITLPDQDRDLRW